MKILNLLKNQKGFTLVELLLYMGVFSILLLVLFSLFGTILSTHSESTSSSRLDQDANFIINRLTYDVHNSSSITTPAVGVTCIWDTSSSTPCQLVLSSSTYTVSGGTLSLTEGTDTGDINSTGTTLTKMVFTTIGNASGKPSVQVDFVLQSTTQRDNGVYQKQEYTTTIDTR